jgi:hypothetical protein
MDTDIFDYEIFVTNIIKSYIELSTSRIHRNMIRKLRSFNSKSMHLLILAASMVAVVFAAQQHQQVQAGEECTSFLGKLACAGNNAIQGYEQGRDDGKRAGLNGESSACPQSDPLSGYCLGWGSGYDQGKEARDTANSEQNGDDNN